jgi:hypothetical protein
VLVTAVETPPAVISSQHFLVRFEEGIHMGETHPQPLQLIRPLPSAAPREPALVPLERRPHRITVPGEWPPRPGDQVTWPAVTDVIPLTVRAVDNNVRTAKVEGKLFEQDTTFTAPLDQLQPCEVEIHAVTDRHTREPDRVYWDDDEDEESWDEEDPSRRRFERDTDADGRTLPERLADQLVFSDKCLVQYRSGFRPYVPVGQAEARLRADLRKGKPVRRQRNEYIRICAGRFEVVVKNAPVPGEPIHIDKLLRPPKPSRGRSRSRRRARKS